jgi:aryl-alcohol dehydrogenase-like predicted oxidoreductase
VTQLIPFVGDDGQDGVVRTTVLAPGLTVPVQGLGCMRMVPSRERDAPSVLNRALDLGVTFLDTADLYSDGRNEELVGRTVRSRREEVVLGTKFGALRHPDGAMYFRGDPGYTRAACEASLRRLGIDVIDLYYLHHRDPAVPIGDTVGAMAELVAAGKVRHLGLCEVTGDELRAAHAVHPIAALQSEWSLWSRRVEAVVAVCVELGVGVVPYCPQGAGLLTGSADVGPPPAVPLLDLLRQVAQRHGAKPGQIALAWVQQRAEVWGIPVIPIPGTVRLAHLEENAAAAGLTLSAEELAELEARTPSPVP